MMCDSIRISDGRIRGTGNFVLDDAERLASPAGDAGCFGDVRIEDLGAAERCFALGRERCRDVACYVCAL